MKLTKLVRHLAALLAVVGVASCTMDSPTAPAPLERHAAPITIVPPAPELDSALGVSLTPQYGLIDGLLGTVTRVVGGLLTCEPLPFTSASQVIGPAGGTIRFGQHQLTIPAGALDRRVTISVEAPSDTVNSVRLYPHGLDFDVPARLTLSYDNCGLLASALNVLGLNKPIRIAYTTESLQILYWVRSSNDPYRQKVTGYLDHFSRYAVGW